MDVTRASADHLSHFYDDESDLTTTVATFLEPAFSERLAILAIGTAPHLAAIEERFRSHGHDLESARAAGQYVAIDAEQSLPDLLVDGVPSKERFDQLVGERIAALSKTHGGVRAFGELVNLLWRDGRRQAALRLEELWNDALGYHPCSVVCGYSMSSFGDLFEKPGLPAVINAHTRVSGLRLLSS
jgi:hypothetical protein